MPTPHFVPSSTFVETYYKGKRMSLQVVAASVRVLVADLQLGHIPSSHINPARPPEGAYVVTTQMTSSRRPKLVIVIDDPDTAVGIDEGSLMVWLGDNPYEVMLTASSMSRVDDVQMLPHQPPPARTLFYDPVDHTDEHNSATVTDLVQPVRSRADFNRARRSIEAKTPGTRTRIELLVATDMGLVAMPTAATSVSKALGTMPDMTDSCGAIGRVDARTDTITLGGPAYPEVEEFFMTIAQRTALRGFGEITRTTDLSEAARRAQTTGQLFALVRMAVAPVLVPVVAASVEKTIIPAIHGWQDNLRPPVLGFWNNTRQCLIVGNLPEGIRNAAR